VLFDEANATSGKRGKVKDAHDRCANVEIGYLAQRLDAYAGMAIVTANVGRIFDAAFIHQPSPA